MEDGGKWINNLQGIIQRQDQDKIPPGNSPLLVNISLDRVATWAKRKGTDMLSTTAAGVVNGGIEFIKNDYTRVLRVIRGGDLQTYNFTTDAYTAIDASQFNATTHVESVNFTTSESRVYHVATDTNLCYEKGATCTDVGAGGDEIRGNSLAVAQETLFIGGITYASGGAVGHQSRVYYSEFDSTTNYPSDQMWNTAEGDLASSTRFFILHGPCIGLFAYSRVKGIIAFTKDDAVQFDVRYPSNDIGPQKIFSTGLANPRAIVEVNHNLVWMDAGGRVWGWNGSGGPKPFSWDIEDDVYGEALINKIDKSGLDDVCAGSLGSNFWFSIGDVTIKDKALTNVQLKGLITQQGSTVLWTTETYPQKPNQFINATDDGGNKVLLYGDDSMKDIYKMGTGSSDNGTAIDAVARMRFENFDEPFKTKVPEEIKIKYRPQTTENTYLKVCYAKDGNWSYETLSDYWNSVTSNGVINMYDADASTKYSDIKRLGMPNESRNQDLSLELSNDRDSESFEISAVNFKYKEENLDIRPEG